MATRPVKGDVASRMTPFAPELLGPYATLIEAFLRRRISAVDFEATYLRAFKDDGTNWPDTVYQILNEVFLDVDAFYPDATIQGEFVIDEAELRRRVERSLVALRQVR